MPRLSRLGWRKAFKVMWKMRRKTEWRRMSLRTLARMMKGQTRTLASDLKKETPSTKLPAAQVISDVDAMQDYAWTRCLKCGTMVTPPHLNRERERSGKASKGNAQCCREQHIMPAFFLGRLYTLPVSRTSPAVYYARGAGDACERPSSSLGKHFDHEATGSSADSPPAYIERDLKASNGDSRAKQRGEEESLEGKGPLRLQIRVPLLVSPRLHLWQPAGSTSTRVGDYLQD
ncbi:uncharacterized protein EV422DRAFT_580455 [Fimicolochytrium jonesii]|uniref:uncharacterized protein n=1 Tax=Fimicolochytrium jonesii TaxID=1396493 RepID=UPI0022FE0C49|nr:uncharacterized protein EV422DRAFT_580455 [Fimicolochytrium jonesii]KAI8817812.1 hypothetical protein EV422DRAFT_580455 [Fimicolochytrium jonesii]